MADQEQQLIEGQLRTEASRQELDGDSDEDQFFTQQGSIELENEYAFQLAQAQEPEADEELLALQEEASSLSGPSLLKYGLLLLLFALPNDIIDAIDFTGIGFVISWLISAFLSFTTILLMWFSDSQMKRVKSHLSQKEKYIQTLTRSATKIALKLSRFAPKNPLIKVIAGAVLEFIPVLSILPWSSISVVLAYMDESSAFKEVREGSGDLAIPSGEAYDMV